MRRAVVAYRSWAGCRGWLLRVLHGTRLPDDRHFDLAGIRELFLDLADDIAREAGCGEIVDLLGSDEDADFAAGLDGEAALDAGEALGDRLQVLEPPHVRVHRLAARARPTGRDGVGDLDDRRLD